MIDKLMQHGIGVGGNVIKSIQRGVTETDGDVPISPINMGTSILIVNKSNGYLTSSTRNLGGCGRLTNSNTLTFTGYSSTYLAFSWEVIEFHQGVINNIQRGTFIPSSAGIHSIEISPVNLEKTIFISNNSSGRAGPTYSDRNYGGYATLVSENEINFITEATSYLQFEWQVIEFK